MMRWTHVMVDVAVFAVFSLLAVALISFVLQTVAG